MITVNVGDEQFDVIYQFAEREKLWVLVWTEGGWTTKRVQARDLLDDRSLASSVSPWINSDGEEGDWMKVQMVRRIK